MNKKENTLLRLDAALERIMSHNTRRIPSGRKLSTRAVEDEAGLGNGSAYYYPEIIQKIRNYQRQYRSKAPLGDAISSDKWKQKVGEVEREKEKLRTENHELKILNAQIAADQYRQMLTLAEALRRIKSLEENVEELTRQLTGHHQD
jgi:hypothetical protein